MFAIFDAAILKPLPFPQPDQIVAIWEAPRPGISNATTVAQFLAWKRLAAQELGIRVALGASPMDVRQEGLWSALQMAAASVAIGLSG